MKIVILLYALLISIGFKGSSAQNTWVQKNDLGYNAANVPEPTARTRATGFSIGNKGYIGLGYFSITIYKTYYKDFWEYDPNANTWTQKADFGGDARYDATGFSIDSKGYIGLGKTNYWNVEYFKDFYEYDPDANTWTQKADFGGGARSSAVGFNIADRGYLGTGSSSNDFWEYDPTFNTWTQKADFAGLSRYNATGFSIGSRGYIGTGSEYYSDFWEYDPATNGWMKKADFGGGGRGEAVGFSCGSKGYIGTGYHDDGFYINDFWEYTPDDIATGNEFATLTGLLEIYPNPVKNELMITMASPANEVSIQVYDLQEKIIELPTTFQNTQMQINTTSFPNGFYTLQITNSKTGKSEVSKFVKQK